MKQTNRNINRLLGVTLGLICWLMGPASTGYSSNQAGAISVVSAASFDATRLASESIVAAFGVRLATATLVANFLPLPTTLMGTTVRVKDSARIERLAPIFFTSLTQVNYQIPPGTLPGEAQVTITASDGTISTGTMQIAEVAPGLFSADGSGRGMAAALALRVKADGSESYEPVTRFDTAQNKFVSLPIDLGPMTDRVFLLIFGTGLRHRSSLSTVIASIGEAEAEALYAGPQGTFTGLDQLNLRIPRLVTPNEVEVAVTMDNQTANSVRIKLLMPDQVPAGTWGGEHISVEVTGKGATLDYDCAHGSIDQVMTLDANGNFDVLGKHYKEHPGPSRDDEIGHPARYTGSVYNQRMTLQVTLTDTKETLSTFSLTYNQMPRVYKCR